MFKKNIKPILMAGALALATAVSPVMAKEISNNFTSQVDSQNTSKPISGDTVKIKKTLYYDDNLTDLDGNLTFTFTVTPYNENKLSAVSDKEKGTGTAPVVKVNNVETSTGTITFAGKSNSTDALAFQFVPVNDGSTRTTTGNYYYTLEETQVESNINNNITYSTTKYTIIVQVQNSDANAPGVVEVNHLVIKNDTTSQKGNAEFTNIYNEKATLKVEKQVKGTGAKADSFDFVIDLTLPENFTKTLPDNTETCEFDIAPSVSTDSDKDAGSQVQFNYGKVTFKKQTDETYKAQLTGKLADDGLVTITGLPVGTTYKVSEKDTEYDESVSVNGAKQNLTPGTMTVGEKPVDSKYVEGTIIDSEDKTNINHVTFTNTKGSNPLTGVIVNNMPYIALLGASGAGLVVLAASKKRSKK